MEEPSRLSAAAGAAVAEAEGAAVAEAMAAGAEESVAEPEAPAKPRHRLRGLAGWAVYLAVIIVAILLGPRFMGWALDSDHPIATVSGDSMWPTLQQGDLVLLKGVSDIEELEVGDIIGFRHADGMAIHRIARIEGDEIIARGDANFRDDPPVGIEDVVGKVPTILGENARIPYLGHITSLLGPLSKETNELAGGPATADDQGDELSARQELP
jgi:signal peptidase I